MLLSPLSAHTNKPCVFKALAAQVMDGGRVQQYHICILAAISATIASLYAAGLIEV